MNPEAEGLAPEDAARAGIYGLLARLYYAPPDQAVLAEITHAPLFAEGDAPIARAWRDLAEASRVAYPVILENEHTELFVGTGKAEVTPYLLHYTLKHSSDVPLVGLRAQLQAWGIARRSQASEPEDHVAGLCETLRIAIAVQHRSPEEQRAFFTTYLADAGLLFCSAVSASPKANFYGRVAAFTREFLLLEREAFAML